MKNMITVIIYIYICGIISVLLRIARYKVHIIRFVSESKTATLNSFKFKRLYKFCLAPYTIQTVPVGIIPLASVGGMVVLKIFAVSKYQAFFCNFFY